MLVFWDRSFSFLMKCTLFLKTELWFLFGQKNQKLLLIRLVYKTYFPALASIPETEENVGFSH